MLKFGKYYALFALFLSVSSCKEPDNTSPEIRVIELTPAAADALVCGETVDNVITLNSTQTFDVRFELTDDEELSQFKLDLHNNFDCHGHSGKVETTDWFVIEIEDVSGSSATIDKQLEVPTDVTTGNYHFSIQATDAAGNSAESAIFSLNVTNASDAEVPVLSVVDPSDQSFSIEKGTDISFSGTLYDNLPLGDGTNARIELFYWQSGQAVSELVVEEISASVQETYNFSFDATVPVTAVDGSYIFELRAYDAVNNAAIPVQFNVQIF